MSDERQDAESNRRLAELAALDPNEELRLAAAARDRGDLRAAARHRANAETFLLVQVPERSLRLADQAEASGHPEVADIYRSHAAAIRVLECPAGSPPAPAKKDKGGALKRSLLMFGPAVLLVVTAGAVSLAFRANGPMLLCLVAAGGWLLVHAIGWVGERRSIAKLPRKQ